MIDFKSIKIQLNVFLIAFAVWAFCLNPVFSTATGFLFSVTLCIAIEMAVSYFKNQKFRITSSTLTTWLIIGFVMSGDSPWWLFFIMPFLILSIKRLVRFHGKNIFNPAATGIFLAVLLLRAETEWKGAYSWYFLIPAGLYLAFKIKKTELLLSYFLTSLALFMPQAMARHIPFGNIAGYFNYFFICIMLIEPKTTPAKRWPKIFFGAGVAMLVFTLTEWGFRYEPEILALLVFNALTPWLDKIPSLKFPKADPVRQKGEPMKKIACFFLSLFFILASAAFAHPPSDIEIKFDPATQMLSATIKHAVNNPKTHYVYKIDIGLYGREIKSVPFAEQKTPSEQIVEVQLEGIKRGDVLSVEAYCNLSGKLQKEITVA